MFSFKRNKSDKPERLVDPARRRLFKGRVKTESVLRLPWAINDKAFTESCTQCGDCIDGCETNIIVKDEFGFPKVDFTLGECTFCDLCITHCQQPLFVSSFAQQESLPVQHNSQPQHINPLVTRIHDPQIASTAIEPHRDKPWPATLKITNKCLAKNNIYCQSCRDECEPNAIKFVYLNSSIPEPTINETDCTQCGACISSCPQESLVLDFNV
ncbi:ferredoxin-type protein NapF [Colwellia asteriadis]|uniref:Ferredoxin-type protein NapF n=1 Tax=Colwellia asteriadis TaxID=517723 RepID=A0ABP3WMH5_9GAMM